MDYRVKMKQDNMMPKKRIYLPVSCFYPLIGGGRKSCSAYLSKSRSIAPGIARHILIITDNTGSACGEAGVPDKSAWFEAKPCRQSLLRYIYHTPTN